MCQGAVLFSDVVLEEEGEDSKTMKASFMRYSVFTSDDFYVIHAML